MVGHVRVGLKVGRVEVVGVVGRFRPRPGPDDPAIVDNPERVAYRGVVDMVGLVVLPDPNVASDPAVLRPIDPPRLSRIPPQPSSSFVLLVTLHDPRSEPLDHG